MTPHRIRTARGRADAGRGLSPVLPALLFLLFACSDKGPTEPDPDPIDPNPAAVDAYVASLGSWEDFSPLRSAAEEPTGAEATSEQTIEEMVNGALQNVTYQCTATPISLTDTPREIVMYEPNASIMWVGNLIQGDSYAGGAGTFQELSIRQRDTLRLSIDLLTGDNFAVVPNPSLSSVQSAIGELIQAATDAGHRSGSSIDYEETLSHSSREAALRLGLSARYMGVQAAASLDTERAANERTMTAHFVQKMFTIAIELPQSPEDMFSSDLTQALWQQQIDAGNIGPTNLPVYIAQVTYGRTLTYTLTSTHSESRMRAAIAASYDGVVGGASGFSEVELRETLNQQNIRVTAIGGEGQNVLNLISSGNLRDYFTTDAPLTSAKPLSYQLNFLGDNSVAKVSETTSYTRRECSPKPATGGRFEFLALQQVAAPVPSPYSVLSGDFNGDGRDDLAWVHTVSGSAEAAIGFGQADATFDIRARWTHPAAPPEGWANGYEAIVGDIDGDGSDDLVWNRRQNAEPDNAIYVALSNDDGTFDARPRVTHTVKNWATGWRVHTGDLDGDGADDLIWTYGDNDQHAVYTGVSAGDGTFAWASRFTAPNAGWASYRPVIGDVNGDGRDDIIWNSIASLNRTYVSRSNGDGTVTLLAAQNFGSSTGWGDYTWHTGDFNRDGRIDMLWNATGRSVLPLHRAAGGADARLQFLTLQEVSHPSDDVPLHTLIGDFNGDGGDDVLWNRRAAGINRVFVGLSNVDAEFEFTPLEQEHPASQQNEDWTAFSGGVLVLDVNGDGLDDVVWNERSAVNRIYVARARPVGIQ